MVDSWCAFTTAANYRINDPNLRSCSVSCEAAHRRVRSIVQTPIRLPLSQRHLERLLHRLARKKRPQTPVRPHRSSHRPLRNKKSAKTRRCRTESRCQENPALFPARLSPSSSSTCGAFREELWLTTPSRTSHSVFPRNNSPVTNHFSLKKWAVKGSNLRPSRCKRDALPLS